MTWTVSRWGLALIGATLAAATSASAHDGDEGRDPAFLPRFTGAEIRGYRQPSLDEIVIPTGAVADAERPASVELLQGEVAHIDYRVEPAVAPLAVEQHYRKALQDAGYDIRFACRGTTQCGRDMGVLILNSGLVAPSGLANGIFSDQIRLLVARKGTDWVLMHVNVGPQAALVYVATVADGVAPQ